MLKKNVLKMLNESDDYISGQRLCEKFAVSRTAIWKVIKKLKEEGYQIESGSNKGYHLIATPDILTKSEIENHLKTKWIGTEVFTFDEIDSTNVYAKELGEKGKPHGTIVVAETQTDGRGRRGRSWESPKGSSISMSVLLRPQISSSKASMLTIVMALAVLKGMQEATNNLFAIKWPNDVLLNKRKFCGILTEMSAEPDFIHYVIIGVGLNVNMDSLPKEQAPYATSLKAELGQEYNRIKIINCILCWFEKYYQIFLETEDLSKIKEEYSAYLINKNEKVCVMEQNKKIIGIAKGITDTGELVIELENKKLLKIYAGEVSVRGIYGYV